MNYLSLILSMVKEWFWYEKIIFFISIPIVVCFFILAIRELIFYCINGFSGCIIVNCGNICNRLDGFTNNMYDKYYIKSSKPKSKTRNKR